MEEMLAEAQKAQPQIVVISSIPPLAVTHARAIYTRLRSKFATEPIIVGLWNYSGDITRSASRIGATENDRVLTTLTEAVLQAKIYSELAEKSAQPLTAVPSVRGSG
jgi:hypothetical protein